MEPQTHGPARSQPFVQLGLFASIWQEPPPWLGVRPPSVPTLGPLWGPKRNPRGRPSRLSLYPEKESRKACKARAKAAEDLSEELAMLDQRRPKTRADCHPTRQALVAHLPAGHPYREHAPCPFVSCRHHLHLDVHDRGDLAGVIEFRPAEHVSIEHTCALDVADKGGLRREEMPGVLGVSEDRTRDFEQKLYRRLREDGAIRQIADEMGLSMDHDEGTPFVIDDEPQDEAANWLAANDE